MKDYIPHLLEMFSWKGNLFFLCVRQASAERGQEAEPHPDGATPDHAERGLGLRSALCRAGGSDPTAEQRESLEQGCFSWFLQLMLWLLQLM